MACRIGMTTDPDERKSFWMRQHPNMRDWQILEECLTKSAAQDAENRLAVEHGCVSSGGGDGPEFAVWYVYGFNY